MKGRFPWKNPRAISLLQVLLTGFGPIYKTIEWTLSSVSTIKFKKLKYTSYMTCKHPNMVKYPSGFKPLQLWGLGYGTGNCLPV